MTATRRLAAASAALGCVGLLLGCPDDRSAGEAPRLRGAEEEAPSSTSRLQEQADAAYAAAEYDSARVIYRRWLDAATSRGDSTAIALALTALSRTTRQLGEYAESRRYGADALELKLRLGLRAHLFDSYNALGLLAWEEDRLQDASAFFTQALQLTGTRNDTAWAKASANLALVLHDLGRFPEARHRFEEAARIAHQAGNPRIEGLALNNLAVLELEVGRPEVAQAHLLRAGPLLARAGDRRGEFNWLGQMGAVAAALGEPGRGITWLDSALRRSRLAELPQEEASNLEQLADLHQVAGDPRRALDLLRQAEALNARLGRSVYLGTDLRREAEIDARLGDLASAERKATEAARVHREAGARFEELADLLLLSDLANEGRRLADAAGHLASARRVARSIDAPTARIAVALAAARLALQSGRPGEVFRALGAEREAFRLAGHEAAWQAELLRSRAYASTGDLSAAAAAGQRAIEAVERVRDGFGSGLLRNSYQARQDQLYAHQVEVLFRLGRTESAWEVADAGRGRALLEHLATRTLGDSGSRAPSVRELAEGERKLLARLDSVTATLRALASEADPSPTSRTELAAERERLGRELERSRNDYEMALVRAEERGGVRATELERTPAGAIRAALSPDEALLEYLVTPSQIILFVVRRDTVRSGFVALSREELRTRVRVARELVATPGSPATGVLAQLFEALIRPARESGGLAGVRRLLLVPHAELQYLPFAALIDSVTGRYLVEDFTLLHLPSAATLPLLRSRGSERRLEPGGVAFAPFPDRLPATVQEASAFRDQRTGSRVRKGRKATELEVRRALARDPVVHFATHGFLSVSNPLFSRVELAPGGAGTEDNGRLEIYEVLQLEARSSLVFLSGCETGAGAAWQTAFNPGEDYATLAGSFLHAGVLNVVGTLWRIEDESAAAFATAFYRALLTRSPVDALAEAQRSMIGQGRYRSPYYWGAYRLDGGG